MPFMTQIYTFTERYSSYKYSLSRRKNSYIAVTGHPIIVGTDIYIFIKHNIYTHGVYSFNIFSFRGPWGLYYRLMVVPGGAPQSTETHLFRSRDPAALLGSSSLGSAGEFEGLSSLLSSIDNIIARRFVVSCDTCEAFNQNNTSY